MTLVAFGEEEQVTVGGEAITLRLDFRAITIMEGALQSDMLSIIRNMRSGRAQLSVLGQMLYACTREHHSDITLDQAAGIMFAPEAKKIGFALDRLMEKILPYESEDRKPKKAPTRSGRSKTSADAG
jgi:hypothetical protein